MDDMSGSGWVTLGSAGHGVKQFSQPCALTIGHNGKIYICDTMNNRIVRIDDITGKGWTTLSTDGTRENHFVGPHSMVIANSGKLYVADNIGIEQIDDFTGAGWTTLQGEAIPLSTSTSLALDAAGNLYADVVGQVVKITPELKVEKVKIPETVGRQNGNLLSICFTPMGKIAFADSWNDCIVQMDDLTGTGRLDFGSVGEGYEHFIGPTCIVYFPGVADAGRQPVTRPRRRSRRCRTHRILQYRRARPPN